MYFSNNNLITKINFQFLKNLKYFKKNFDKDMEQGNR